MIRSSTLTFAHSRPPSIRIPCLLLAGLRCWRCWTAVRRPGGSVSAFCHRHFEFMGDTQISSGLGGPPTLKQKPFFLTALFSPQVRPLAFAFAPRRLDASMPASMRSRPDRLSHRETSISHHKKRWPPVESSLKLRHSTSTGIPQTQSTQQDGNGAKAGQELLRIYCLGVG